MDVSATIIDALRLTLWLGAPALIACLLTGLLVGLVQTATQANDASIGFVPKWFAVAVALFLSREHLSGELLHFSSRVLHDMAQLGH